jgi:hypothetical protein
VANGVVAMRLPVWAMPQKYPLDFQVVQKEGFIGSNYLSTIPAGE